MRTWLQRYRHTLIHLVAIVLPLVLLNIHGRRPDRESRVSSIVTGFTAPGQATMDGLVDWLAEFFDDYIMLIDAEDENEQLRDQRNKLQMEVTTLRQHLETADRQAKACGFRFAREDLTMVPARVIAQDLGAHNQVIRVAIQLADDATIEDIKKVSVITPLGLMGRVVRCDHRRYCDVQLITDPGSRIHARAGERGVLGSVKGVGPGDSYGLRFETTEGQARLRPGDAVVTSGHDGRHTRGLVVGVIAKEEARQSGVHLEYRMNPVVPFWQVREVFLVVGRAASENEE
jgi:cell shape-determining protein MreC